MRVIRVVLRASAAGRSRCRTARLPGNFRAIVALELPDDGVAADRLCTQSQSCAIRPAAHLSARRRSAVALLKGCRVMGQLGCSPA